VTVQAATIQSPMIDTNANVRILVIIGTRPEAIKLAPVVRALAADARFACVVCTTGQHKEMLGQMVASMQLAPDYELDVMLEQQSLASLTARAVSTIADVIESARPAAVVVQGDTTSCLCGALAAFYAGIPVAHVEAGLRSGQVTDPFPEELNRRLVGQIARWHFAPTLRGAANLHREGVEMASVHVTGNTAIDNLRWVLERGMGRSAFRTDLRRILVTLHRRENQGEIMRGLVRAIRDLAARGDVEILLPLHKNPSVREVVEPVMNVAANVTLIESLDYFDFTASLADSYLVLTDSGGVQEEAPTLGKPVLVLRETTERPEAIEAGTARLVGTNPSKVYEEAARLLDNACAYAQMAKVASPFGDGKAANRIVARLAADLPFMESACNGIRHSTDPDIAQSA
jgi:UDP-N-acetylglucosamine 2-epimerase (non-hydrolysing)